MQGPCQFPQGGRPRGFQQAGGPQLVTDGGSCRCPWWADPAIPCAGSLAGVLPAAYTDWVLRTRPFVWLILTLALSVQAIAAVSPQLTRPENATRVAPGMHVDCSVAQTSDAAELPACCGDACPDMTVCAAAHAMSATTQVGSVVGAVAAPDDQFLLPAVASRLSSPFRPPTHSHA